MIAYASTGTEVASSPLAMFAPLIFMGAFLYFFVIKPQKKRQQAANQMRDALKAGDTVVLYSGLIGTIIEMKGDTMVLEIAPDDTHLTFKTWSIREVLASDMVEDEEEYEEDDEEYEYEEVEEDIVEETEDKNK